jgi:hypothetical protein
LKKKINSVSKNLERAKKDLEENKIKIVNKESNKNSDLNENKNSSNFNKRSHLSQSKQSTRNSESTSEISKFNRNLSANKKSLTFSSKNFNLINNKNNNKNSNFDFQEISNDKYEDEENLNMNNRNNIKIISTKIEKNNENIDSYKINNQPINLGNSSDEKSLFFSDEELDKKIKYLEKNLLGDKNKMKNEKAIILDSEMNNYNKENLNSTEEDNMYMINKDLNHKFDNLLDLEESMKKLNQILEFSNKSSLKFKLEQEVSTPPKIHDEQNLDIISYSEYEEKEPLPYKMESSKFSIKITPQNTNLNPKIQNNNKTIDISKSKRVFHIDEKIMKGNIEDSNANHSYENLDYLKDLLLQTKSDLENLNKKFD